LVSAVILRLAVRPFGAARLGKRNILILNLV